MPEIIITYYDIGFPKEAYFKIKKAIKKVRGAAPGIKILPFHRDKKYDFEYGKIQCFSSGPMILDKSRLIEKLQNELCKEGLDKEDFKIDIKRSF